MKVLKDLATKEMENYFGRDIKRINHAKKVTDFASEIIEGENIKDLFFLKVVTLAAVFHDIGIHEAEKKHGSSAGKFQEIEGPAIARRIFEEMHIEEDVINRVCYIIGGHHTESKIDNIDFKIIWDADLLVNISEENIHLDRERLSKVISKSFKTETGRELAEKLYLKE